jgi:hypothetical protein
MRTVYAGESNEQHQGTLLNCKACRLSASACISAPIAPDPSCIRKDHVGSLLADHDGCRIGIAGNDAQHDRGIDHAQAGDTAHAQPLIDHGIESGMCASWGRKLHVIFMFKQVASSRFVYCDCGRGHYSGRGIRKLFGELRP